MTKIMGLAYHLLTIHLLLLSLFSFPLAARATDSKIDQAALLSFKSLIYADPLGVFSSWNESLHHCQWQGVMCGRRHPDRVTALVLDSKQLSGYISPSLANLTFLQNISLSDNQLMGSIPLQLGYLSRLRYVNLSMNILDGNIPPTLGNCSKLEIISLRYNHLQGIIPSNLAQCKELKTISLGNNFLKGGIPPEFGLIPNLLVLALSLNNLTGTVPSTLGNLSSLEYLHLDQNNFDGYIPNSLGKLTNLSVLHLHNNNFMGSIPLTFGNLIKLSILHLHNNNFMGFIPLTFGNLIKLSILRLEINSLNGPIPPTLGNLTSLLELSLFGNRLSGAIPSSLGNLNNIEHLYLFQNRLSGFVPDALGKLQNLRYIDIYDNNISGEIPHSLYNISTMVGLELSGNQLEGTLPFDMCDAFPNLQYLFLFGNQLNGQIPPTISNCSALSMVMLGSNHFSGIIPSTIGTLKNLHYLTIEENQLEAKGHNDWSFINALANCTSLQWLFLGNNQLQGVMPRSIANLSTSLLKLSLSHNLIFGSIPIELRKLNNLDTLQLDHMLLSGTIPEEIGNLFRLETLNLSSNSLSGHIQPTFGNLTQLTQLFLNDNALEGSIPLEIVNMKRLLEMNLSNNKLTGQIPKEIMGLPSLSISLDLSHNYLTGILPPEIGNFRNLPSIRLSSNKLSGELPSTIGACEELQALYLDNNLFHGKIPSTLSNLRGLQVLDISNNSFSGQVPKFISGMNLQYLNISFNNFQGELPREGIFKNISGLDVRGNPNLCGGVPELHLPQCISETPTPRHHSPKYIMLISAILGSAICLTIVICLVVTFHSRKRSQNNPQSDKALKYELKLVSYNDILRATGNFSSENLIGRGTFGTVYKAIMSFENVTTVAVKVLNLERHGASKSFISECEALRNMRHRNLIKVLSVCSSTDHQRNDFKALVFEYMSNGSLEAWLHPNSHTDQLVRSLNLSQRLNIAIDVAIALDYLHSHGPTSIVHCDLKPSNVLLDDDMTAHMGDFGLARFLVQPNTVPSQSTMSTGGIKGSIGYIPPEYGMGGQPSVEGDVYSYGILLLEMFSGVSPTDERFGDGLSLPKHVEMAFPEHVMDTVDSKLFSQTDVEKNPSTPENVYECLVSVLQCGLLCSKELPKERISIKDVLNELNLARKRFLRP